MFHDILVATEADNSGQITAPLPSSSSGLSTPARILQQTDPRFKTYTIFPLEIWQEIFSFLPDAALWQMSAVCVVLGTAASSHLEQRRQRRKGEWQEQYRQDNPTHLLVPPLVTLPTRSNPVIRFFRGWWVRKIGDETTWNQLNFEKFLALVAQGSVEEFSFFVNELIEYDDLYLYHHGYQKRNTERQRRSVQCICERMNSHSKEWNLDKVLALAAKNPNSNMFALVLEFNLFCETDFDKINQPEQRWIWLEMLKREVWTTLKIKNLNQTGFSAATCEMPLYLFYLSDRSLIDFYVAFDPLFLMRTYKTEACPGKKLNIVQLICAFSLAKNSFMFLNIKHLINLLVKIKQAEFLINTDVYVLDIFLFCITKQAEIAKYLPLFDFDKYQEQKGQTALTAAIKFGNDMVANFLRENYPKMLEQKEQNSNKDSQPHSLDKEEVDELHDRNAENNTWGP